MLAHPSTLVTDEDYREALYRLVEEMICDNAPITAETAGEAIEIAEGGLIDYVAECGCVMLQNYAGRYQYEFDMLQELKGVREHMIRSVRYSWRSLTQQKAAHESGNRKTSTATVPQVAVAGQDGGILS